MEGTVNWRSSVFIIVTNDSCNEQLVSQLDTFSPVLKHLLTETIVINYVNATSN